MENEDFANRYADALRLLGRRVVSIMHPVLDFSYHTMEFGTETKERQVALFDILTGNVDTLILTPQILNEQFIPKDVFKNNIYTLKKGQNIDPEALISDLTKRGYMRVSAIDQQGQIAKRGDVVDIFPLNANVPVRVYFFDTEIEKINTFNILSQYAIESVESVSI